MIKKARNRWEELIIESEHRNEDFGKITFNYWVKLDKERQEIIKEAAELFKQSSETEIPLEKTSQWVVKNQALTTRIKQEPTGKLGWEIKNQEEYIKSLLKSDIYEPGNVTELQLYLEKRLEKGKEKTQIILQQIYLDVFEQTEIFSNLLQVISQIEYQLITPAGPIMALAATRHHSCEVRERGLRCYENWENAQCLAVLKGLHFEEKWLQNYLELLIADFEEGE